MTIQECYDIGNEHGLNTIEECLYYLSNHSLISAKELVQLIQEIESEGIKLKWT